MEVEIYADLLFLVNAGMDGLCFYLTGRLLHRRLSSLRTVLGAVLGGFYAVAALFFRVGQGVAAVLDLGVCLLLCRLVFGGRHRAGRGGFFSASAAYFLLSMILGGVMTALYNLLNRLLPSLPIHGEGEGIGTWLFALLALTGGGIALWGGRFLRRTATVRRCRVSIELNGRRVELDGLVDSGNLLRDPMGGRAVICCQRKALAPLLSPALAEALGGGGLDSLTDTADGSRIRLIPAATATGGGMLVGFRPDRVEIVYLLKSREVMRSVDAVIAAAETGDAEALVPGEMLE
jgi:stage II sporulation protein GA (sporulation sigma-E factor processing peptidase)